MPTYDYYCSNCKCVREVKHSIVDKPLVLCDNCGTQMQKIITTAVSVQYKGDWFKTKGKY